MIVNLIVFSVIYVFLIGLTMHSAERLGNVFLIVGIIISSFMMWYCFGTALSEESILSLTAGIVHLVFGLFFCYLIDIVDRKVISYKISNGYKISDKPKKKLWAVILAFLFGWCGGHKFYLGKKSQGAVYAMFFYTTIPAIIGVIDGICYFMMPGNEFDDRYNNRSYGSQIKVTEKVIDKHAAESGSLFKSWKSNSMGVKDKSDSKKKISELSIDDLQISIGSASVESLDRNNMKICIKNADGKVFEFKASGSRIESFKVNGNIEKAYEV